MAKKTIKKKITREKVFQHLRWAMAICLDKQINGDYFVASFEIWIKETERLLREEQ